MVEQPGAALLASWAMIGLADVQELVTLGGRAWNRLTPRLRADHHTILAQRGPGSGHHSGGFYAMAVVAPSRQVRRPMAPSDLAEAATEWVRAAWPGTLDGTVNISVPELVRFEARGHDGEIDLSVEARPSGLVETRTRVPPHERKDGVYLDLVDVLRPVVTLARAIEQPPLRHVCRRRRLDWHVNLSSHDARGEGSTHWAGLILPGSTTTQRASNAYPVTPQRGFAPGPLTGWRRRRSVLELMVLVAKDLLMHTGYHSFGDAPVEAARQALAPIATGAESGNGRRGRLEPHP